MGLINENQGLADRPGKPMISPPPRPQQPAHSQALAPKLERDWRREEIHQLRAAICRQAPSQDDAYWNDNQAWVGCVEVSLDKSAGPGDFVKLSFKAIGKDGAGDIWDYFQANKGEFAAKIRRAFPAGNTRIVDLKFEKGSVTLIVLIQITIGIVGIVVAVLSSYDAIEKNFKRAMPVINQWALDTISSFKNFFRGFGFGAA